MTVRSERNGAVTTVVLSRPGVRNAVDGPTANALADAFRTFDADAGAAVAVLWGEGGTFCSGADLSAIGTDRGNRVADDGDGPMGPTRLRLRKPVIAAISGYAVAGGLELALWCDLRVAEEDAVLGVFCRRWGVPLIDGGTVRLPRLIGLGRALDMILTGRAVPAAEALQMGLVTQAVPLGTTWVTRPICSASAAGTARPAGDARGGVAATRPGDGGRVPARHGGAGRARRGRGRVQVPRRRGPGRHTRAGQAGIHLPLVNYVPLRNPPWLISARPRSTLWAAMPSL